MTSRAVSDNLLDVRDVVVAFKGVRALDSVSFSVKGGEICSIIGPNGAGKSSLLNVINGVYRPQQGSITFDGETNRNIQPQWAARRGIARTFQNIALFKGMTVLDNVMTGFTLDTHASFLLQGLGLARREERQQRERAEEIIEFLKIQAYRGATVGKLAYGLQKRVELARALAARPKLLLLDEPMAGMSFDEKRAMTRFIVETHAAFGITSILIEHDMGVVMDISDHVVVLEYGRKIADGAPEAVQNDPAVIDAYLGVAHAAPAPAS